MFREIAHIKLKNTISVKSCIGHLEKLKTFLQFFVREPFNFSSLLIGHLGFGLHHYHSFVYLPWKS